MSEDEYNPGGGAEGEAPKKQKNDKRLSVERIYQKKTQLEHIILRPDSYIGSPNPVTEFMWIHEDDHMVNKEIKYVPGFYKIFDEILVNAADNKQRDPKMDTIKLEIKPEEKMISIMNNGKGIPVEFHKEQKMYVPTMIFGHLLTSSNFNDDEQKTTGGRNGYGAKLCNVFSTKFIVETADKKAKKSFKQTWGSNMTKAGEPKIKEFSGEEYTKITFYPDLAKFQMEELEKDTVSLFTRRAYDIAASSKGVKVFLNGKRLPVKNFKDYVDQYIKDKVDDTGNPLKLVHEQCGERWEVAVCQSEKGFQQMSFVNSIATSKGGRHVDHVADLVVKAITEKLKKGKSTATVKPFQVKNHMWLFINCLIVNPSFDSQTKENMTLAVKDFGSKCNLSEKFKANILKTSGIAEAVTAWSRFKEEQKKDKTSGRKTNKVTGIQKLEDAVHAGGKMSSSCSLILTEGDSAKGLAMSGRAVIGAEYYGVFPLKGKLLNVREATAKTIMDNAEIGYLVKILGLTYKKKYETMEDLKTLRYGKILIMTDQDQDGSHIKGLLINFIHHNWPGLLKLPFLEEFITPIVKATKGSRVMNFYSLPEFNEWKEKNENWNSYKIKYYKGLGTSTPNEAKEYFTDMERHRIRFSYSGPQDDHSINLAFSKKEIEGRKDWLTNHMEEGKRRKELGLPDVYLYEKDTRVVNYTDFINKEFVLFSNMDNERSIPCLVDGFKPGQRKVMFTCFKRKLYNKEVKVAQLQGSVSEKSAYHHGEASLIGTIINLAQNYVGSNNINLLLPIGQFGTRYAGGHDAASARYITTKLSPITSHIFNIEDENLLKFNKDDNLWVEPEWYMPIIPMVLVNGAEGIGTGWSTKIPNYNPREIVKNLKRMINGGELKPMIPWYKNYQGTIEQLDSQKFVCNGEIAQLANNKIEITELPIRVQTQKYKEDLEKMTQGSEKAPAQITDAVNYSSDEKVRFVVTMTEEKLHKAETGPGGLHAFFKLQATMSTSSMVLFDHLGCLRKYETTEEILQEFFDLRLKYYAKRKRHMEGALGADLAKLSNQARFIMEKCDGTLKVENKKKKVMIEELQRRGFDSDPANKFKKSVRQAMYGADAEENGADGEEDGDNEQESQEVEEQETSSGPDYEYLLGMKIWSLTLERKEAILKQRDDKKQELEKLKAKTKEEMWHEDLDAFVKKLDQLEEAERKEAEDALKKGVKPDKKKGEKGRDKKVFNYKDVLPSPSGIRVLPRIADDLKLKAAKAVAAKSKAKKKSAAASPEEKDEFDMMIDDKALNKSLGERIGATPEKKPMKQTKLNFPKASPAKGKKKGNPWSDEEDDDISGSDLSDAVDDVIIPREKAAGGRRAAAQTKKYAMSESEKSDDSEDDSDHLFENSGIQEESSKPSKAPQVIDSDSDDAAPVAKPKATNGNAAKKATNGVTNGKKKSKDDSDDDSFVVSDSSDEDDFASRIAAKKKPATKKLNTSEDLFDSMLGENDKKKPSALPAKKAAPAKKPVFDSDSADSEENYQPNKKAAAASKKMMDSDLDSDNDDFKPKKKAPAKKPAAAEKPKKPAAEKPKPAAKKKKALDSDSEDERPATKKSKTKKKSYDDSSDGSDMEFNGADIGPARDRPGRNRKAVNYGTVEASESDSDF